MTIIEQKQTCRKCESDSVVYVDYSFNRPDHYDGASEVLCLSCGARFGRWTGMEILEGEEMQVVSSKQELEAITYWLRKAQHMLERQGELVANA